MSFLSSSVCAIHAKPYTCEGDPRSAAAARRLKRKSERALEAVVDAGAAQRRRNARADKKKESRLALSAERKAHKARGTLPPELAERRAAKKQRRGGAVA